MPRRKPVLSLLELTLNSLSELIRQEALRVSHVAVTQFVYDEIEAEDYEEQTAKAAWEREVYLSDQIELFKQHFHGHIPHSLVEKALGPVLDGVKSAISAKKSEWTPTTNLTRFTRQMYAIVKFSNLLVLASRKKLDLDALPKMIRTKLYGSLKNFTGLRELYLGSD